jgi:hypothetical protein
MRLILLTFLFSIYLSTGNSQSINRPFPEGNGQPYEFYSYNTNNKGFYLCSPFFLPIGNFNPADIFSNLYIIDNNGYIFWYQQLNQQIAVDFKYNNLSNNFSYSLSSLIPSSQAKFIELTNTFNISDTILPVNALTDNHDYMRIKNKGYLLSARKDSIMDLSPFSFGGVQGKINSNLIGYVVQELDSNKNLVFEWNSNDYIHPTEMNDGYANQYADSANFDYAHGNSIDKDSLGFYYVSLRHTNCIYKIDSNGSIVWRLGGKLSDFVFTNDSGFSGQHDARILPNGNISLYDNTNTSTIKKSRGVEYLLDTSSWTATRVKETIYTDSVYARAMGGYQVKKNGDRILNYGLLYRPSPSILHYDSNNTLISEFYLLDTVVSYRTFFYDSNELSFLPQQPEIDCYDTTILAKKLIAPGGYSSYKWSNGDTTKSIVVYQSGEYQVWVNYGEGMLGSKPITIDINSSCGSVGIEQISFYEDEVITIYNVLGEKISKPIPNQINIYQYKSGRIKKVIPFIE